LRRLSVAKKTTGRRPKTAVIPAIPTGIDSSLRSVLESMKQAIENMAGTRAGEMDRVVSLRDLEEMGFDTGLIGTTKQYNIEATIVNPTGDVPHPPAHLELRQLLYKNVLTWTDPKKTADISGIEIWRSASENRSEAALRGVVPLGAETFEDGAVMPQQVYYYWIRSVSYGGKYSIWEPNPNQGGLVAPPVLEEDIQEILEGLTGDMTENELVQALNSAFNALFKQWSVKVTNNGHVAGVGLAIGEDGESQFVILSDKFLVIKPDGSGTPKPMFVIGNVGGTTTVGIHGDMIVDGVVQGRMIAAEAISAQHIGVDNLSAIKADIGEATAGILRSGDSKFIINLNEKFIRITA
jgi:hypothetical protein